MASSDPAERRRIARLGGLEARARGIDTRPAWAGRMARYLARVDELAGGQPLEPAERQRRADALLRADMARLSRKGVAARAANRAAKVAAARAEADRVVRRWERQSGRT